MAEERAEDGGGMSGVLAGLIIGTLAGATLAMILAPQTGE
jgi:gas vesicle protein